MPDKYLIINADDYNTDAARNRGIIEAMEKGSVTSVTVLANMPCDAEDIEKLKAAAGNTAGVHLNLTHGSPLTKKSSSLTDTSGRFYPKHVQWRRALAGALNRDEIEQEFIAQIEELLRCGIEPDHIDGNNHMHVFPCAADAAAKAAKRFNIRCIRLPREKFYRHLLQGNKNLLKKIFINLLCMSAGAVFKTHNLVFTDCFAGISFPDLQSEASLRCFLEYLPDGTTELMCHPGYSSESGSAFSTPQREVELRVLTDPIFAADIQTLGIRLISFGSLA